jgi:hypothetical protein
MRIPALPLKRKQWEPLACASPSMALIGAKHYTEAILRDRKRSFENPEALAKRKSPKDALDTAANEWDKITERRGPDKQKAAWGEKLAEMEQLGIEYEPDWAAKAT